MKINELIEGKTYEWMNCEYKIVNGLLITGLGNTWQPSTSKYNSVIEANFEEILRIPDENTPVNTKVRVKDYENDGWIYPRYFANYLPNASCKFWVFNEGDKSEKAVLIAGWNFCEIV